jgi:phosphopantetheinyl transferase (holo-ACP synthase)
VSPAGRGEPRIVVELARVDEMPPALDPYWADRLTASELAYCAGLLRADEHLCARVAAKRAVARALGWPGIPWAGIEIRRNRPGPPGAVLTGDVEDWRRLHTLPLPGVSLTHAAGWSAAVAWLPEST